MYLIAIVLGAFLASSLVLIAFPHSIMAVSENKSLVDIQTERNTRTEQSTPNGPPTADAGNNQVVKESDKVLLDGSGSSDPGNDKLSYNWQFVSPRNLQIKLEDAHSAKANFVAPSLEGVSKLPLFFKLTVSDGDFRTSDIVQILVTVGDSANKDASKTKTVTIVDTGAQPAKNQFFTSDLCGAGTSVYSYLVQGVKWRTFPVTFAIDATNSHIDANAAKAAVRKAFASYDALNNPAGTFFQETSSYSTAKIKVTWKYIDGPFNKLGYTSFSYRTDTRALTSATVTFDSGDKYFVSSTDRCGASGTLFDVQNIATHEIGHAINLGHVSDKLQSMYPTAFAGETLKRSLGNGDKLGETRLY